MSGFIILENTPVRILRINGEQAPIHIGAETTAPTAACPRCGQPSAWVKSHYWRTPRDVPWRGWAVQWHLRVRRFVCTNPACSQAIFCERLPGVAPYQRWTRQAQQAMVCWTLVTSASDAARQLQTTGFPVSRQTLNRWILAMPLPDPPAPRVIGLDEWARRKGQRYATIVVDHERGTILDILPDTRAETVAAWLRAHPTVAIVTRDRAVAFAHAIAEGVPQAQPVADRFHLFRNLADAVERFFQRHPEPLPPSEPLAAPEAPTETPNPSRSQARWAAIHARLAQGDNLSAIARALNLDRHTVRKYARMPACWR